MDQVTQPFNMYAEMNRNMNIPSMPEFHQTRMLSKEKLFLRTLREKAQNQSIVNAER